MCDIKDLLGHIELYKGVVTPTVEKCLTSLEADVRGMSITRAVTLKNRTEITNVDAVSKESINERLSYYLNLTGSKVYGDDLTALKDHLEALAEVVQGIDVSYRLPMFTVEATTSTSMECLHEMFDEISELSNIFVNEKSTKINGISISYNGWNLNIHDNNVCLQEVREPKLVEHLFLRGDIEGLISVGQYLLTELMSDKWYAYQNGLITIRDENVGTKTYMDKVSKLQDVIVNTIPEMVAKNINVLLSVIHRYIKGYDEKAVMTPIFKIRNGKGIAPERTRKLLTRDHVQKLGYEFRESFVTKAQSLESLDVIGETVAGLGTDLGLEAYTDTSLPGLMESLEDLTAITETPWKVIAENILADAETWEPVAVSVESFQNCELIDFIFMESMGGVPVHNLHNLNLLNTFIEESLESLNVAVDDLIEGDDRAIDRLSVAIEDFSLDSLPTGKKIVTGETVALEEDILIDSDKGFRANIGSIFELYFNGVGAQRTKMTGIADKLNSMKGNFGMKSANSINNLFLDLVKTRDECLEDLGRHLLS